MSKLYRRKTWDVIALRWTDEMMQPPLDWPEWFRFGLSIAPHITGSIQHVVKQPANHLTFRTATGFDRVDEGQWLLKYTHSQQYVVMDHEDFVADFLEVTDGSE